MVFTIFHIGGGVKPVQYFYLLRKWVFEMHFKLFQAILDQVFFYSMQQKYGNFHIFFEPFPY